MTPDTAKRHHPGGDRGALLEMSFPGGNDNSGSSPPHIKKQAENNPSLTCALLRADELRGCLVREISRAIAISLQAQAALLDCDDALAIENLRRHWIAMRGGIAPLAAELRDLAGGQP
jgi:hypothetical protein